MPPHPEMDTIEVHDFALEQPTQTEAQGRKDVPKRGRPTIREKQALLEAGRAVGKDFQYDKAESNTPKQVPKAKKPKAPTTPKQAASGKKTATPSVKRGRPLKRHLIRWDSKF